MSADGILTGYSGSVRVRAMGMPIVFDLDGTLVDSAPDIRAALNGVLVSEGLAPLDLPTVTGFIGNGVPVLIARAIAHVGADPDHQPAWEARFLAGYDRHDLTRPFEAVDGALRALAAAGHPLGICTNKPEGPARGVLAAFGWSDLFATVIGGDTLARRKPDPSPLLSAVAALGGGPALFVGDSEVDAATALAAGVPFGLFTRGYRKTPPEQIAALVRFDDFAALPALVEGFG
jgi:phosphoglycolate phosphatase